MAKEKTQETEPTSEPVRAGDASHAEPTMTVSQVLDLMRATVAANALTPDKMIEIVAAATSAAAKAANPIWWDERTYHEKSVFSHPEGNFAHAKSPLTRQIFWVGYKLEADELTPAEIEALNAIQPGRYPNLPATHDLARFNHQWVVTALDNLPTPEKLLVSFPCKEPDRRSELPSLLAMCRVMTPQAAEVAA